MKTRDRIKAQRQEKRELLKQAHARDPADWQELHSPTQPVEIKISQSRKKRVGIQRILHKKLLDNLTYDQQRAAENIAAGYSIVTSGLGFKQNRWERIEFRTVEYLTDRQVDLAHDFWLWREEAARYKIDIQAVLRIIVWGDSCRKVDADYKKRGFAMGNLVDGLDIYTSWKLSHQFTA